MRQKNKKIATRTVVVTGMLMAMIVLLMVTGIGFLRITPAASVTLMSLPVLIGVMAEGLPVGLLLGFLFGVISFAQSFSGGTLLSPFFMNPLVSVLPRLLIPCGAHLALRAVGGENRMLKRGIAAFAGSATNTVAVLGMIYLMSALGVSVISMEQSALGALLWTVALTNGLPEAVCMALVTPPILAALDRSIYTIS